ncbi:MAG TPA: helix-turn-helix domain-containing protein [Candidatus Limnocylindria bacterium]|nr:helix-turn-helix domain-containing protein [Candidatus Limnocylindria bacterium]
MAPLGTYLRGLREKRGTSLEEIARSTRVAARCLESLEAEEYGALPAPVFTRGFIRAYCQFFGVAPDEALALYDQREGAVVPASDSEEPRRPSAVLVSFILLVVLGVALFAVTLMIQPSRDVERRAVIRSAPAESRAPEPPAVVTPPAPAPSDATVVPAPPPAAVEAAPAPTFTSPYRLVARAVEPTWIRVRTEDGRSTEETLPPGEVREWVSDRPFVLTVGNAGGITLELNGRTLPSLGARGAVISRLVVPPETR